MTETSAATLRAIIESSTDLPTPDPAKMPIRCPRQQVVKVLSARTPRSRAPPTRWRAWAGGGALRNVYGDGPRRMQLQKFGKEELGSYPIHFHIDGDLSQGAKARGADRFQQHRPQL